MRVITWRYLRIKLGWGNEWRDRVEVEWKRKERGKGKKRAGKLIRISVSWGFFVSRSKMESSRTKVGTRATDGHLDRSARLFLNAPLLSWAVSKVSRVLGFPRGDQYYWSRASQVFEKTLFPRSFPAKYIYIYIFFFIGREDNDPSPALIALDGRKWNSIFIRLRDFPQGEGEEKGQPTHAISFHLWFFVKAAPISDRDKI